MYAFVERPLMPHAIQIRQTGGPEVLKWTPIEVGEPGPGQVRLRQAAGPELHRCRQGLRRRKEGLIAGILEASQCKC